MIHHLLGFLFRLVNYGMLYISGPAYQIQMNVQHFVLYDQRHYLSVFCCGVESPTVYNKFLIGPSLHWQSILLLPACIQVVTFGKRQAVEVTNCEGLNKSWNGMKCDLAK